MLLTETIDVTTRHTPTTRSCDITVVQVDVREASSKKSQIIRMAWDARCVHGVHGKCASSPCSQDASSAADMGAGCNRPSDWIE